MKTTIFYFSGTGNSLKVARELAARLGDAELAAIPRAMRASPRVEADRIGIVFPVYMWGLPLIVADFCRRLEAKSSAVVFAVATCGGSAAGTLRQLEAALRARGLSLASGFVLRMPGNYTPMYGAPSCKSQEKLFAAVAARIPEIVRTVQAGGAGPVERGSWLGNLLLSQWVYKAGSGRLRGSDKSFWVDDKCNGCGICRKVCPVANIVLEKGRPFWQHHCEQCMACLQWCPQEAIQSGKRTPGRARYHHPEMTAKDFMLDASR